ncbi:MAG: hypothetical protein AB7O59_00285 [Pirellulales bacterium]
MRVSRISLVAALLATGCATGQQRLVQDQQRVQDQQLVQDQPPPAAASAQREVRTSAAPPTPAIAEPAPAPASQSTLVEPVISREELTALVKSIVAEELAKREQPAPATPPVDKQQLTAAVQAAVKAAIASAEHEAQLANAQTQEAAQQAARQAAEQALADDEKLARFLLLPNELERVARLQERLQTENIWGLSLQDLDFAASGIAAPLLHNALFAAAERHDPNIELDVLAQEAALTPQEKIELATLPPIERERLLIFTGQFDAAGPSLAADRYLRSSLARYPFLKKIVLAHLRDTPAEPAAAPAQEQTAAP